MGLSSSIDKKSLASSLSVALIVVCSLQTSATRARAKISATERANIIREMMSEQGTAKILIPCSKKALDIQLDGSRDEDEWSEALDKFGPAARVGELVEITKVEFKGPRLIIEFNHGIKGGRKWWHRVQIAGAHSRGTTLGSTAQVYAPGGTKIALIYDKTIPSMQADDLRAQLKPVLDFEQRSATELYIEKLPEEFQIAIKEKTVIEGMDREMVLLAKNRPDRKVRDVKDGIETEDWIYGVPPGEVTFITLQDGKVIRVKETYANVGGHVKRNQDPNEEQNN